MKEFKHINSKSGEVFYAIMRFAIWIKMSACENYFFTDKKLYIFNLPLNYDWYYDIYILERGKGESAGKWLNEEYAITKDYAKFVEKDGLIDLFLNRMESLLDGKEQLNAFQCLVPEAFPPRYIKWI